MCYDLEDLYNSMDKYFPKDIMLYEERANGQSSGFYRIEYKEFIDMVSDSAYN
jgi:hypothetical protein